MTAVQRPIEGLGIDGDEHIAGAGAAGDLVAAVTIERLNQPKGFIDQQVLHLALVSAR